MIGSVLFQQLGHLLQNLLLQNDLSVLHISFRHLDVAGVDDEAAGIGEHQQGAGVAGIKAEQIIAADLAGNKGGGKAGGQLFAQFFNTIHTIHSFRAMP